METDSESNQSVIGTRPSEFRPTDRQIEFLELPDYIFEALYGGALGGGKSWALVSLPIFRQFHKHYAFRGIIFRRTFAELEKYIIPLAKELYEPAGGIFNEGKHFFRFPSNAIIFLAHMEQEKDVYTHDTNEYHYVGIDQSEKFSENQLRYITSRIRSSIKELPRIFRMSANPGGISHVYLRDKFIKPARSGRTILYDKFTNTKRIFIPAKLEDNPYMMENDPGYYDRLNLLPEKERQAKKEGDWFALAGMVFSEFRPEKLIGEPDNALHISQPFEIPEWWPKIISIDWGFTAYTCALWGAISPDDRLFIYREYHQNKTSIANWAADVARLSQWDGNIKKVVLDPSAWQNRGDELTIDQQFQKWSKFIPHKADNDRLGGKQLIHDFLRFEQKSRRYIPSTDFKQERFDRILRLYGLEAAKDYQKVFIPEPPETNLPRLQLFECPNVTNALLSAQYDDKHPEDIAPFKGDDAYDALRYLLKASDHYLHEVNAENELRRGIGAIDGMLKSGEIDQTSYYARMEYLEHGPGKLSSLPRPVKLFH